jgi:hypothetical protein
MIKALVPGEGQDAIGYTIVRRSIMAGAAAWDTASTPGLMTQIGRYVSTNGRALYIIVTESTWHGVC